MTLPALTRPRPFILTGIAVAVAGVILMAIILPAVREIRALNERIHRHRQALEVLYRQGQNLRSSIEEYETVKAETPLLISSVLTLGEELQFITALEDIAARHALTQVIHLDTSQSTPLPAQKNLPYQRVLVRLDLQGTVPELIAMLQELESLPSYMNILSISISSDQASRGASQADQPHPHVAASITAATYWKQGMR